MSETKPHILLIEEDPTLAEVTSFRLELLGHEVAVLHSAEEAFTWLETHSIDLIIVGHFLPGMDGFEFMNRLSNEVKTSHLPTMLLSPNAELDDVQKAFNAGADEYLVTPFDPQTLEQKVDRLINHHC